MSFFNVLCNYTQQKSHDFCIKNLQIKNFISNGDMDFKFFLKYILLFNFFGSPFLLGVDQRAVKNSFNTMLTNVRCKS